MPDPPASSLLTRYVLENPWPAALLLLLIAAVITWRQLNGGTLRGLAVAALVAVLGIAVALVGVFVQTPGEHAVKAARALVADAERGRAAAISGHFEPEAVINFGSVTSPAFDRSVINRAITSLASENRITSNQVTRLRGYTADPRTGVVHLSCITETASSYGPVPSHWVIQFRLQADGSWQVDRITCLEVAGRPPRNLF